jgi:cysteine synthase
MSMSGGATLAATGQWLTMQPKGQRVLGFHYDTGERRLSIEGLFAAS